MGDGGPARAGGGGPGKTLTPEPGGAPPPPHGSGGKRPITDPREVRDLLREQSRRTNGRDQLSKRHENLERVSPQVGVLDAAELSATLREDPDATLRMLADMAKATDESLRRQARALAARLLLPVAPPSERDASGAGKLVTLPEPGLDLDLDATLERVTEHPRLRAEDLRWRGWRHPARAYLLVVDASGSTTGAPLVTAVTTAAALASRLRPGDELAVIAFWSTAVVLRDVRSAAPVSDVLNALFDLRGGDTTDLGLGLRLGLRQAAAASAARREVIALTDGMANEGVDPITVAAAAAGTGCRVHTLALSAEPDAVRSCARVAASGGGASTPLLRPSDAPNAVAAVLRSE